MRHHARVRPAMLAGGGSLNRTRHMSDRLAACLFHGLGVLARNDDAVAIDEDRSRPAEGADRGRNLTELFLPQVAGMGLKAETETIKTLRSRIRIDLDRLQPLHKLLSSTPGSAATPEQAFHCKRTRA
jgi:hypothetical protein